MVSLKTPDHSVADDPLATSLQRTWQIQADRYGRDVDKLSLNT